MVVCIADLYIHMAFIVESKTNRHLPFCSTSDLRSSKDSQVHFPGEWTFHQEAVWEHSNVRLLKTCYHRARFWLDADPENSRRPSKSSAAGQRLALKGLLIKTIPCRVESDQTTKRQRSVVWPTRSVPSLRLWDWLSGSPSCQPSSGWSARSSWCTASVFHGQAVHPVQQARTQRTDPVQQARTQRTGFHTEASGCCVVSDGDVTDITLNGF